MVRRWPIAVACVALLWMFVADARASVALLLEEPYGVFGSANPTGHAAIYFDHICAETPTRLRRCEPGEAGVVVSRYHRVNGLDWVAIPLVPYLYAVNDLRDVPASVDEEQMRKLRDDYRHAYLREYIPDTKDGSIPNGDWYQLVGESYLRKMYGFQLETTQDQDDAVIAMMNDRRNKSHFNLFFRNCADFSRNLLNDIYPKSVHRSFVADFGMTTPKHVAHSLVKYGDKHPEAGLTTFVIPQVDGTVPRSHRVDGVAEAIVKSKKYVVPMALLSPVTTVTIATAWLAGGRLHLPKDGPLPVALRPDAMKEPAPDEAAQHVVVGSE